MKGKEPRPPASRQSTIRRQIEELLATDVLGARDISAAIGIAEKEVYGHLEHLRRSLHREGGKLRVTPAECRKCGYVFVKRQRLTRPSRCPVCRGESVTEPLFALEVREIS